MLVCLHIVPDYSTEIQQSSMNAWRKLALNVDEDMGLRV
jgi:hypothetical protein